MTTSTYTMRRTTKSRIEHAHGPVLCRHCRKAITVGQIVVSIFHGHRRNNSYKIYHEECYEQTLL
jgi:hypothetical protein